VTGIKEICNASKENNVIVLTDSVDYWANHDEQWNEVIEQENVFIVGMRKSNPLRRENEYVLNDFMHIMTTVAMSMAIFMKAPGDKKTIIGDSWLAECCNMMTLSMDELRANFQDTQWTPPWRLSANSRQQHADDWWRQHGGKFSKAYREHNPMIPYELKMQLNKVLDHHVEIMNRIFEDNMEAAVRHGKLLSKGDFGQALSANHDFKKLRDQWKLVREKQELRERCMRFLPAITYTKLMKYRWNEGKQLYYLVDDEFQLWQPKRASPLWSEILDDFMQHEMRQARDAVTRTAGKKNNQMKRRRDEAGPSCESADGKSQRH
jgi:hypothetical protein